jgi:hypothetical protein
MARMLLLHLVALLLGLLHVPGALLAGEHDAARLQPRMLHDLREIVLHLGRLDNIGLKHIARHPPTRR